MMKKISYAKVILSTLIIFTLPILTIAQISKAEENKPVKIGVLYALSGDGASFGINSQRGAQLAISEFPTDKIEVFYEDASAESGVALVSATKKLLNVDKVEMILGTGILPQATVVGSIVEQTNIPVLTGSLCSNLLTKYKNVICGYPSTAEQLSTMTGLSKKLGIKTLSLIFDESEYSTEVHDELEKLSSGAGYKILSVENVLSDNLDFRTMIAKLRLKKPDALFSITTNPAQSLSLFKQLQEQGYAGQRLGYLDVDETLLKNFGKQVNGVLLPGYLPSKFRPEFVENYKKKFGVDPEMYAATAYSMARLALEALEASNWDAQKVIGAMINRKSEKTAFPGFYIREDHTLSMPTEVLEIKDGKLLPFFSENK